MATGFKLANQRDYRRGVVLGLTLAEVLVLLVFLLLLTMSALLLRRDQEQATMTEQLERYAVLLRPVTEALTSHGMVIEDTDRLASLIERGREAEQLRGQLLEASQRLEAARIQEESDHTEISRLRESAKETLRLSQAATERDALASLLERVPGSPLEPLTEKLDRLVRTMESADSAAASLTGQNAQMRNELARLKGNGGSGLPYCWALPDGRPQFMLKVEMQDTGVIVHYLEPRARPEDPAWQLLDGVGRDRLMPMSEFIGQTSQLQARSTADRCRYAIQVVDGTGVTNKPGYKQSMGRLWSVFMIREVSR
jgi:hypothetical protein